MAQNSPGRPALGFASESSNFSGVSGVAIMTGCDDSETIGGFGINNDFASQPGNSRFLGESDIWLIGGYDSGNSRYSLTVQMVGTDGSTTHPYFTSTQDTTYSEFFSFLPFLKKNIFLD